MTLSNEEKWLAINDGACSPQNFIEWSWRFVVSAALQRRVWYGPDHMQCFPNTYTILVGKAGIGKGVAIAPAMELLRYWKQKDFTTAPATGQQSIAVQVEAANAEDSEKTTQQLKRGGERIDPPRFPYAPDATTYEKLVEDIAKSGRRINCYYPENYEGKRIPIYFHCSMYFTLPELASLLRKRTDDTVNFLLSLYDCPLDYEYKTKTKECDRVRRGCLNLLAGTTPEFMASVFDANLINQGFSSRVFFIYANKNRKNVFSPPALTPEQLEYKKELLEHLKKLSLLFGRAYVTKDTEKWLEDWWDKHETNRFARSNTSPKLDPYYARKNIHIIKVAMANHFGESTDLFIPQSRFEEAASDLAKEEINMSLALTFEGANPLGKLTDLVLEYLGNRKGSNIVDLCAEFWKQSPEGKKSIEEVLSHLISQDKVAMINDEDEVTGRITQTYIKL